MAINPIPPKLADVDLLAGLTPEELSAVASKAKLRRYSRNQSVLHHLDDTKEVFFLVEGRLRVTIFSGAGKEISFRDVDAGTSFGEISAIDGQPRSAGVVALDDCTLVSMTAADFRQAALDHPVLALNVMTKLAGLVRSLSKRVFWLSTPVPVRICAELRDLARANLTGGNTARIRPAPKHADVANRLATHREAVSRVFSELKRGGVVRRAKGELIVTDVEALDALIARSEGSESG